MCHVIVGAACVQQNHTVYSQAITTCSQQVLQALLTSSFPTFDPHRIHSAASGYSVRFASTNMLTSCERIMGLWRVEQLH